MNEGNIKSDSARETLKKMQEQIAHEAEVRKNRLLFRKLPEKRTLQNALDVLTRNEIDDIAFNVGMNGVSSLNKSELIEKAAPAIIEFSKMWFTSIIDEEYQAFRHIVEKGGLSSEFRDDEMRLDYFESIGLVFGCAGADGALTFFMPDEILAEFEKLEKGGEFRKAVGLNTEALRIATGILYFYGITDYETLYAKVRKMSEIEKAELPFESFRAVLLNGSCWQKMLKPSENHISYYTVMKPELILEELQKINVGYASLPYDVVYDAGEDGHIETSAEYRALARFFMETYKMDVLRAAGVVSEITLKLQNGGSLNESIEYIESLPSEGASPDMEAVLPLLINFHSSLRLWTLRGHTPSEIVSGKLDEPEVMTFEQHTNRKAKAGRNDLCPCGSGKKYKNCCMRKDTGEE